MAAAYSYFINKNQPFVDGNKRTGFAVADTFLRGNNYEFDAEMDNIINTMVDVAKNRIDINELAAWYREHSSYSSQP